MRTLFPLRLRRAPGKPASRKQTFRPKSRAKVAPRAPPFAMAPGPEGATHALVGARASNAGWSRVRMEPPHGPPPLLDAALAVANDDIYIFGGRTAAGALSPELWRLEHAAGAWSTVQAGGGARPAARTGHSLVALRGSVWLLGGRGASEELLGAQERLAHSVAASSTYGCSLSYVQRSPLTRSSSA